MTLAVLNLCKTCSPHVWLHGTFFQGCYDGLDADPSRHHPPSDQQVFMPMTSQPAINRKTSTNRKQPAAFKLYHRCVVVKPVLSQVCCCQASFITGVLLSRKLYRRCVFVKPVLLQVCCCQTSFITGVLLSNKLYHRSVVVKKALS